MAMPPPPPVPATPAPVIPTLTLPPLPPMPYTFLGCYRDNKWDRVLSGLSSGGNPGMTTQLCAGFCSGSTYFGTEFGEECFCGPSSDQPSRLGDATCDRECSGDPSETCGGYNAISVYAYDDVPNPTSVYLGCYADSRYDRIMELEESNSGMTTELCEDICTGDSFYGTQYGRECWCGDDSTNYGRHGESTSCTYDCAGNDDQRCGGRNAMSVYQYSTAPTPHAPISRGCFTDKDNDRIMEMVESSSDMATERCEGLCDGNAFFGTQYGRECWCGDEFTEYDKHGTSSDCTYECEGDRDQICGGRNAMSVYEY